MEVKAKKEVKLIPELRFREFDGEWELSSLKKQSVVNPKSDALPVRFIYIDLESVTNGRLVKETEISLDDAPSRAQRLLGKNDILYQTVRPYQKNIVFVNDAENVVSSTGTAVIEANEEINNRFLFHQFFSNRFLKFCERMMTGTTYPAITSDDLGLFKVALPNNKQEQDQLAMLMDEIETNLSGFQKLENKIFYLQKSIINQVF